MDVDGMDHAAITDSAVAEASLMDNIDDLFGEAADVLPTDTLDVHVTLPSVPPPPELVTRLSEMQSLGCCTKLAWSVIGSIAQISEDGREIGLRAMVRDQKTGIWNLSEKSAHPIPAAPGTTWQHIQFGNVGADLAAVDSRGSVRLFSLPTALGKMQETFASDPSIDASVGDLDAIVGIHWLPVSPTDFKTPYISPASKIGDKWITSLGHRDPNEPKFHHAADSRQAMFYVSRRLKLVLLYQIETAWHSTSIDLEAICGEDEMLTHASMCEEADHMLLLTHDTAKQFHLYRISVSWNLTEQARPGGMPIVAVAPTIDVKHVAMLEDVASQQMNGVRLTQLTLLSPLSSATNLGAMSYATVMAVFTSLSIPGVTTNQHSEAFSVIARWHLESSPSSVHGAFGKSKNNAANVITTFQRQDDIHTPRIVLSVTSQHHNTLISLAASDGTLELRDRTTMSTIEPSFDSFAASSLAQCGFEQMPLITEHAVHTAPSPDGCAMAYSNSDHLLTTKPMSFRYSWQPLDDGMGDSGGLIEAAVVCLARQYAILTCRSAPNDEVLALIPTDLSYSMRSLFIREIMRMTARSLDIGLLEQGRQQMYVLKEQIIPRIVSAQYVIGVKPGTATEQTTMGRFAHALLNLRSVCTPFTPMLGGRPEGIRPEYLHSLRGLVRWAVDFLVYVADTLISIKRSMSPSDGNPKEIVEQSIAKDANPTIHLLLCSVTRSWLRILTMTVPKFLMLTQKIAPMARLIEHRHHLAETMKYCASLPFMLGQFEALLSELDSAIRTSYTQGNVPPERRVEIENALICGDHKMPEELAIPLETLLNSALPKFIPNVDQSRLYFWDSNWLGLSGSASVALSRRFDAIRKLPLTKGVKLRLCRRCGNRMEDISQESHRDLAPWLVAAQRYCVCFDYWVLEQ